jgi:hypothetical protein
MRDRWFLEPKARSKFKQELMGFLYLQSFPELRRFFSGVFEKSASVGCTYSELAALHLLVIKSRPSSVLEAGSGISTAVILHALVRNLRRGHPGRLTSMEESEKFRDDTLSLIPKNLSRFVEVIRSDVVERALPDGTISVHYKDTPMEPFDLVFIDGPQLPDNSPGSKYFDGDALQLGTHVGHSFTALLDGRSSTLTKMSFETNVTVTRGRSMSLLLFRGQGFAVSKDGPSGNFGLFFRSLI